MHRPALCTLFVVAALVSCGPPAPRRDGDLTLEEADFFETDEQASRVDILPITLGKSLSTELASAGQRWWFSFVLAASARVELRTQRTWGGPEVDTVLALFASDERGRSKRKVAENDDAQHTRFSTLEAELPAGSYLLEVRGYRPRTRGPFTLSTACDGTGCPALPTSCPFGEQFSDLREHPTLTIVSETWIRAADELANDIERAQLVLAVQQSSHTDVRTPSEALTRVDQQEVRQLVLHERAGVGAFTVFEYGAGDNSYGAIFATGALPVLASIHDGDLLACLPAGRADVLAASPRE